MDQQPEVSASFARVVDDEQTCSNERVLNAYLERLDESSKELITA